MHKRLSFIATLLSSFSLLAIADAPSPGGISQGDIENFRKAYASAPATKAIHNAIANNSINSLAVNHANKNNFDTHFSHRVKSKGITNQRSSGRCWLFTGDTAPLPAEDRKVDWLFANPLSDGGQYTGIADNLMKYGVVPIEVMGETASSKSTGTMSKLLKLRLREDGLELRKMASNGADASALDTRKKQMLSEIYRILALNLGEPPTEFTWTRRDADDNAVETKTYTPQSFYKEYAGNDLKNDYVMLMNDPSRDYYKLYEIEFDRHGYDG